MTSFMAQSMAANEASNIQAKPLTFHSTSSICISGQHRPRPAALGAGQRRRAAAHLLPHEPGRVGRPAGHVLQVQAPARQPGGRGDRGAPLAGHQRLRTKTERKRARKKERVNSRPQLHQKTFIAEDALSRPLGVSFKRMARLNNGQGLKSCEERIDWK